MNFSFKDKTVLVCGGSTGIGKAIAIEFAKLEANVVIMSRNPVTLTNTIKLLNYNGFQKHNFIAADFNSPQETVDKVKTYLNKEITIDILINNTGGPAPGRILDAEDGQLLEAFNQHIITSQLLAKELIPSMIENKFGRIINIISVGVKQPIQNLGVSNTIRGAMASWAKTLSREVAEHGITVNNILPGFTATDRLTSLFEANSKKMGINVDEYTTNAKNQVPMKRFASPQETAYSALFLASNLADYVTGINLPVDGGYLSTL